MSRILGFLCALSLMNCAAAYSAGEQSAEEPNAAVVVVSHVDVMPPHVSAATELLKKYKKQSLSEEGVVKVEILQQHGRPNHYSVVEEWSNQKAFDKHVSDGASKEFRTQLQPMLGAPYDERPHSKIE